MHSLLRQKLVRGALLVMLLASVYNAIWPAHSRLEEIGARPGDRGALEGSTPIPDDRRVRGELRARVVHTPQRTPNGWSLRVEMLQLDARIVQPDGLRLTLFLSNDFSHLPSSSALRPPALAGEQITVFARLERYPKRAFPRLRAPRERMAALGFDARALALEPMRVEPLSGADAARPGTLFWRAMGRARTYFEGQLLRGLSGQNAALALALTTANRSYLEPETLTPFKRTGTSHLLAVSGLHLGVLATIVWGLTGAMVGRAPGLLRRFGRRRVCGMAVVGLLGCYVLLIGAPISAIRAWAVLAVGVGALLALRPLCPFHALSGAAIALMLWQPAVVVDLGFQLSFAATLGILLFLRFRPPILHPSDDLLGAPEPRWQKRARAAGLFVGVSTSASLATMPILAAQFGEVALCGLWVNLVVTPLVSAILFPILVGGAFLALILPAPGFWVLEVTTDIMLAMRAGMDAASRLPGATWVTGSAPWWAVVALVIAALFWSCGRWKPRAMAFALGFMALGLSCGLLARPAAARGELRVHFIPVGQGDATLIEFPDATTMLIDAGGVDVGRDPGQFVVLPYLRRLGIWRLDWVLLTHADQDHMGGLTAVVDQMRPRNFIVGSLPDARARGDQSAAKKRRRIDPASRRLLEQAERAGARLHFVSTRMRRNFGGVRVDILRPQVGESKPGEARNEASLVSRLAFAKTSILLPADIESAGEAWVRAALPGPVTFLKAAHHGSKSSSSEAFLDTFKPRFCIISAGQFSRFGHPHPEVMARYRRRGVQILQTALHGVIRVDISAHGRFQIRSVR